MSGKTSMRAGFAKASITPAVGTRMMGFTARDEERGCTAIHDDVFTRALYLEQGGERVLIMGFDLCFVGSREQAARFKEAVRRKTGIEPSRVLLNASHSHSGPEVGTWYGAGFRPPDNAYLDKLEAAIVSAAGQAVESAREVTVWAGATRSSLPMSRRLKTDKGIEFQPAPMETVCNHLPICLFKDMDGKPVCLIFSISCHPSMIGNWEISAEYPGFAMDRLDAFLGRTASLFLQGAGGSSKVGVIDQDGKAVWRGGTWDAIKENGDIAAREVIAAMTAGAGLAQIKPDLRCAMLELNWPLGEPPTREYLATVAEKPWRGEYQTLWANQTRARIERGEPLPTSAPITLHGIQIGKGLRIVAIPGEPVAEWGLFIKDFYKKGITFPLGYSNDQGLYLPVSAIMDEGGYEVTSYWEYGFPAPLAKGFEKTMRAGLRRLRALGIK